MQWLVFDPLKKPRAKGTRGFFAPTCGEEVGVPSLGGDGRDLFGRGRGVRVDAHRNAVRQVLPFEDVERAGPSGRIVVRQHHVGAVVVRPLLCGAVRLQLVELAQERGGVVLGRVAGHDAGAPAARRSATEARECEQ